MKSNKKDPIDIASTPDRAKTYNQNPKRWQEFSEQTINQFLLQINQFASFKDALEFLGDKRGKIADELKHGVGTGTAGKYGKPRITTPTSGSLTMQETISWEVGWGAQGPTIRRLMTDWVNEIKASNLVESKDFPNGVYETTDFRCEKYPGKNETRHKIFVKSSHQEEKDETSFSNNILEVNFIKPHAWWKGLDYNTIIFTHLEMDEAKYESNLNIANKYWEAIKNYLPEKDPPAVFFNNLAKLARFCVDVSFFQCGGSAILEWMIRGMAFSKGFWLGPFNHAEKIGWDFKAFCTFNEDDYAHWFYTKAFVEIIPLSPDYISKGFSFEKPPFPPMSLSSGSTLSKPTLENSTVESKQSSEWNKANELIRLMKPVKEEKSAQQEKRVNKFIDAFMQLDENTRRELYGRIEADDELRKLLSKQIKPQIVERVKKDGDVLTFFKNEGRLIDIHRNKAHDNSAKKTSNREKFDELLKPPRPKRGFFGSSSSPSPPPSPRGEHKDPPKKKK